MPVWCEQLHWRACFSQRVACQSCVTWMKHYHYRKGRCKQLQVGTCFLIPHIIFKVYKIMQFWLCMQHQHYFKTAACTRLAGAKTVFDVYNWTRFLFPQLNKHSITENSNVMCTLISWAWERSLLYKPGIYDTAFICKSFSHFPILRNKEDFWWYCLCFSRFWGLFQLIMETWVWLLWMVTRHFITLRKEDLQIAASL